MRLFICFISFFIFNAFLVKFALAGDTETTTSQTPVYEPITQDISGRLQRIERILDNRALLDMLELLESLKTEISTLRGKVEVQTHTIDQLKQRQRDLYTDVDKRLQRIESNKTTASSTSITSEIAEENQNEPEEQNSAGEEETVADASNDDEEPIDPLKAEAVYQKAFKLLKESHYDQALKAFKEFLKDYPDSTFSDNAQYWLGEANYVTQNYELAINEYQALCNIFPDSKKVSHALLKIGYSYAELGNTSDAKKTLKEVKLQYPGTTAARLADERLRKIGSAKKSDN